MTAEKNNPQASVWFGGSLDNFVPAGLAGLLEAYQSPELKNIPKEFYDKEGTLPKSEMLVKMHPDVARLAWRFGRWHHYVDYRPYRGIRLLKRKDYTPPEENPYHLVEEFRPVENRKCGMKDRGTHKLGTT